MPVTTILYNIILSPITQIIEISYRVFDKMFGNTGIAVLGVSLTVTLLCLPLYIVAEGWQETERSIQDKMKDGIARIKKAFKGDEQYMMLNTYYRQNHYHPIMALRSSFGILIQIPFFLAAYHTLSALPDLMGQSFFFIRDMGKPDAIFSIGSFSVNILPIAMTLINCVSGAIYSKGHGLREKVQIYGMAAIFLVVLYNSPAGLVLYWTFNNIFSLVKNVFYKLKNPLKSFWIFCCIVCVPVFIFTMFFFKTKTAYKLVFAFAVAAVYALPFILKGTKAVFHTFLTPIFDHGASIETGKFNSDEMPFLKEQVTASLLVKDFNDRTTSPDGVHLRKDMRFMTNADTPALALEGINDEAETPFTNMKYKLSAEEKNDYTKICKPQAESTRNRENKKYTIPNDVWWTVSDDIYKDENWKQIFPFGK